MLYFPNKSIVIKYMTLSMSNTNTSRSQLVDIAKGVAIIAVVLLRVDYQFYNHIFLPFTSLLGGLWHVAVFFLLGGFFLKEEKLIQPVNFIKGKIQSLYKLLLYFYISAVLFYNVLMHIGWYDEVTDYGGKMMSLWGAGKMVKELVLSVCLAGREPILGAMWFVYVLFIALCGLSIVSWVAKKTVMNDERQYEAFRAVVLLVFCIASCSLTNLMGITIPQFSNSITAMWLIYVGYMLRNKLKVQFNNAYLCVVSILVAYHSATIQGGGYHLK